MSAGRPVRLAALLLGVAIVLASGPRAGAADGLKVQVARLAVGGVTPLPLSLLDTRVEDEGAAGAALGLEDNATTGRFLGHAYALRHVVLSPSGRAQARAASAAPHRRSTPRARPMLHAPWRRRACGCCSPISAPRHCSRSRTRCPTPWC